MRAAAIAPIGGSRPTAAPPSPADKPSTARLETSGHPFAEMLRQVHAQAASHASPALSGNVDGQVNGDGSRSGNGSGQQKSGESAGPGAVPKAPAASEPTSAGDTEAEGTVHSTANANANANAAAKARARLAMPPGKHASASASDAAAADGADGADDAEAAGKAGPASTSKHAGADDAAGSASGTAAEAARLLAMGQLPGGVRALARAAGQASGDADTDASTGASAGAGAGSAAGNAIDTRALVSGAGGKERGRAGNASGQGAGADAAGATPTAGTPSPAASELAAAVAGHAPITGSDSSPRPPTDAGTSALAALAQAGAAAPGATAMTATAEQATLQCFVAVPVDAPAFADAFGMQVSLLAQGGVQRAELHLNPAGMGPVSIHISLTGSEARIDFGADLAATRKAIETSLPQLAGALADAGFTLAGGGVSEHAGGRAGADSGAPRGDAPASRTGGISVLGEGRAMAGATLSMRADVRLAAGAVDLYA